MQLFLQQADTRVTYISLYSNDPNNIFVYLQASPNEVHFYSARVEKNLCLKDDNSRYRLGGNKGLKGAWQDCEEGEWELRFPR